MKTESIKTVLPKMVSIMLLLFLLFLLPVNLYIQMYMQHQTQRKSTTEMFSWNNSFRPMKANWEMRNRTLKNAVSLRQIW